MRETVYIETTVPNAYVSAREDAASRYHREVTRRWWGDALHLALASLNELDYVLTWNVRHLANPNKVEHLTAINRRLGLLSPVIISPDQLWMEESR
ncbi:MAG: hypothetical protein HQ567_16945 [Candidatus Nealsonbacteria bacterium]|nr:hypothetical protein [Candidatus Nealsonbacteria bacterium]